MQIVNVLVGPPGSGKSLLMRETAISQPGLYLVAVPTADLAREQGGDYVSGSSDLPVYEVHHKNGLEGTVERQFKDLLDKIDAQGISHAVVFITQESLLTLDLGRLTRWHIFIDEVPHVVRSGALTVPLSWDYLANLYDLVPLAGGWSVVKPRTSATSWRITKCDSIFGTLAEFDQEARRPHGLLINAETWEEVGQRGTLEWMSIWTPASLAHCASVSIAGAGFFRSLAYHAVARLCLAVQFERKPIPVHPRAAIPTLRLHYFVEAHRGSTTFWKTREGRQVLTPIRRFLSALPDLGYWSGNEVVKEQFDTALPIAAHVKPKIAGSNKCRDRSSCALIYSAQWVPEDKPLTWFGLGKAEIEESREFEDLYQFVMRGRMRDPSFGGVFDAYVYSRAQAEKIASRAIEDGVATVEFVPHPEVGVMDVIRPTRRPEPSPEDKDAKREARRERDRLRKKEARANAARAAGRTGQPGRPPKPSMSGHPNAG